MIELLFAEMFGDFTLNMLPKWIGAVQALLTPDGQTNHSLAFIMARLNLDETLFLKQFQVARQCGSVH